MNRTMMYLAGGIVLLATVATAMAAPWRVEEEKLQLVVSVANPSVLNPAPLSATHVVQQVGNSPGGSLSLALGSPVRADYLFPSAHHLLDERLPEDSAVYTMRKYVVLTYSSRAAADVARTIARIDGRFAFVDFVKLVQHATPNDRYYGFPPVVTVAPPGSGIIYRQETAYQWNLRNGMTYVESAWDHHRGTGRIGLIETGADTANADLTNRFSYFGSYDFYNDSRTIQSLIAFGFNYGNHGTHVAGIASGRTDNTDGIGGVCWNCTTLFGARLFDEGAFEAGKWLAGWGAQAINLSAAFTDLVTPGVDPYQSLPPTGIPCANFVGNPAGHPFCASLEYIAERDISFVASAGNNKSFVLFPAREPKALSVGGVDSFGRTWDETLYGQEVGDHPSGCPSAYEPFNPASTRECGTNSGPEQDFVLPAREIISGLVAGTSYIPYTCEDSNFDGASDGFGHCTGTSMAAPHLTGALGLLRSINPLMSKADVHEIVRVTASGLGFTFSNERGWGIPNVAAAGDLMRGTSCGVTIENRLTPMFVMSSIGHADFLYTTIPQVIAGAYTGEYLSKPSCLASSNPVPGCAPQAGTDEELRAYEYSYGERLNGYKVPGVPVLTSPGAAFYVFSGSKSPYSDAQLLPIHRMAFAEACDWRDHAYATSQADLTYFLTTDFCPNQSGSQVYRSDGLEGYLLSACPAALSPCNGTKLGHPEKLYRRYSLVQERWALLLESQLSLPDFSTFTDYSTLLGYAFPPTDTDYDGLPDGFEVVIGTSPTSVDTDGDSLLDGDEFPLFLRQPLGADPLGSKKCSGK